MKKNKFIFRLFTLIVILIFGTFIYRDIKEINVYNEKYEINENSKKLVCKILNNNNFSYPKKEWVLDFNLELDPLCINNENFYIINSKNEKIKILLNYDNLKNIVKVKPKNFYKPWEEYKLVVSDNVKSLKSGISLNESFEYKFDMVKILYKSQTEENYEKYEKVNHNYKGIGPKTVIDDDEDFYNEIKLSMQNYDDYVILTLDKRNEVEYDIEGIVNYLSKAMPLIDNYVEVREYEYLVEEEIIKENDILKTVKFEFDYKLEENLLDKNMIIKMDKKARNKVKEIVEDLIRENMKDWEKEKLIYNYIINNCNYNSDYEETYNSVQNSDYGVLINNKALCGGYAKAFYSLMNEADLRCIYLEGRVEGKFTGGKETSTLHAWNIVDLEGAYYHVDTTWGSSKIFDEIIPTYRYFNIEDSKLKKTHTWNDDYYPVCNSKEFSSDKLGIYKSVIDVSNYSAFYTNLKNGIKNEKSSILFKVDEYESDIYNVEKAINKMAKDGLLDYNFEYITNESSLCSGMEEIIEIYIKKL